MEPQEFEPFGERLPGAGSRQTPQGSLLLRWTGMGLFWSLVVAIVVARAAFFEPGVFDGFTRVAALVGI